MTRKLILLPGMDGTGELFAPFLKVMPPNLSPHVVPLPSSATMDLDAYADFVRKALPDDDPYVLLAESFSSPLAIRIAATYPAGLRALVLVNGYWSAPNPLLTTLAANLLYGPALKAFARPALARKLLVGPEVEPRRLDQVLDVVHAMDRQVLRHRLALVSRSAPLPAPIKTPCIQIIARNDKLLKDRQQEELKEIFPNLASFKLHGPHLLLQTFPQFAARLLETEVERLGETDL